MITKELKKGKSYYYTLPVEWVKVTYLHQTINGYKFKADGIENELTKQTVERYIEEI